MVITAEQLHKLISEPKVSLFAFMVGSSEQVKPSCTSPFVNPVSYDNRQTQSAALLNQFQHNNLKDYSKQELIEIVSSLTNDPAYAEKTE